VSPRLLVAAIWAGRLAQNTVAAIFGVFSAFWMRARACSPSRA
jgi:hypothetical protein